MPTPQLDGLSGYASGTYPVEISVGRRIGSTHRIPLRAAVDVTTGEVRFSVDPEGIETRQKDAEKR